MDKSSLHLTLSISMRIIKRAKQRFSLIELLISVGVLATVLSFLSFSLPRLIEKERFSGSVDEVTEKLKIAQMLAIEYEADVTVHFRKSDKGLNVYFESYQLPLPLLAQLNHSKALKGIEVTPSALRFTASVVPQEPCTLKSKRQQRVLVFSGLHKLDFNQISMEKPDVPRPHLPAS